MNWNPNEEYKNRDVAITYDAVRFSSIPGKIFNSWEQHVISKCFRRIPEGSLIVDVPCGTGRLAERLLALGYRVHGVDISREMLDVARTRLARFGSAFTTKVVDARHIGAEEAIPCSAILCARVLMHFPLSEQITFLSGVAKFDGKTIVINHSFDSLYQRFRRMLKRVLGLQAPANYPISNRDIQVLLRDSGLREVKRYRLWSLVSEAIYIVAEKQ